MKKSILILSAAMLAVEAFGQNLNEPQTAPDPSALEALPDTTANRSAILNFTRGKGAPVDTIDVGDDRIKVVLCDDKSWYFIKDMSKAGDLDVFKEYWDTEAVNPYKNIELKDLPYHVTIVLADSVSRWTCPYQTKVFSKFGYRHGRRHQGVDLPYPKGTPVKAAFDGRVRCSMYYHGYGNLVVIRHENGLETFYGHLSRRDVKPGDWVHSGDIIGLGGSTGRSTGPHLHFETRYKGFAFDPQWIADYEAGTLHKNIFVLRKSYLDASSKYVSETLDDEEVVYGTDEQIEQEEKRIEAEKAAMKWHKVRNGETLSGIAARNGISLKKIKSLNPGINPNKLRIGQSVRIN